MIRYALALVAALTFGLLTIAHADDAAEGDDKDKEKAKSAEKKGLSLKPDRTIEFTAERGTWVTLDISPDGKTILFDLLGDLYTVPIDRRRRQGDRPGHCRSRARRDSLPTARGSPTSATATAPRISGSPTPTGPTRGS